MCKVRLIFLAYIEFMYFFPQIYRWGFLKCECSSVLNQAVDHMEYSGDLYSVI